MYSTELTKVASTIMERVSLSLLVLVTFGVASAPFCMLLSLGGVSGVSFPNYRAQREALLQAEDAMAFGSRLQYQPGERVINDILMEAKRKELAKGFRNPSMFPPARNFLNSSKDIESSEVFKLIRKMPKGAVLHSHASAIVSREYVFNITYRENLYVCETGSKPGEQLALHFFEKPNDECNWRLLSDLRKNPMLKKSLDERIYRQLSMLDPLFKKINEEDGNAAWSKFMSIFKFMSPMIKYRPVHEDHFYQGLQELWDDKVIYLELRATLHPVYELNGTIYNPINVARIYRDVAERFVRDNPKFVGVKLIYAPAKTADTAKFDEFMKIAVELKRVLPDFFVGFDLVGQEDTSPVLFNWAEKLQKIATNVPFFFHAGETDWSGLSVDENLVDAILMNSKRIGHGYALVKHPKVLEVIKRKKIAVEICPISNQVLSLVKDLRNHPASALFVDDFPVVISNDDPGLWGAKALSYDFYEAFMGIMSAHADIRSVKQLAINSIKYSSLSDSEKKRAFSIWNEQWVDFIQSFYPKNLGLFF